MKRERIVYLFLSLAVLSLTAACSSTDKKPEVNARGDLGIEAANEQLARVPVVGFPPFSTTMPMSQFDQYGENAANVAKGVVNSVPEGYVLQIKGHANQHPSKSVAYTKSLSESRARYVYNYFVKKGIDKNKLSTVGVGNSEPDPNLSHSDNRRVTFKIVPK